MIPLPGRLRRPHLFRPAEKDGGEKGRWVPFGAGFRALKNLPRSNPFRPSCSREGRSRASASQKKAGAGRVAGPYRLIILRPDQPFVLAAALLMDLTYLAFRYAQTSLYQISYHAPSSVSSETPVTATTVSVGMVMKTSLLVDGAERTFTSFVVAMLSAFGVMASSCTSAGHLAVSRSGVPPRWLEAKMDAMVQLLLVTSMATCPL